MIQAIDEKSINQICSNQTISNITTIIKELIDNSIDAKSTLISIDIDSVAMSFIEIIDNGEGIDESHFENLCLRGTTTKISNFEDIFEVKTMGFRGQALSAISCLCDLTIITKTTNSQIYTLKFNQSGNLVKKEVTKDSSFKSNHGTKILITDIFKSNPLRKKIFTDKTTSISYEILSMIQSYAIINTEVSFELYLINSGKREISFTTANLSKSKTQNEDFLKKIKRNIRYIYGEKFAESLIEIEIFSQVFTFQGLISDQINSGSKFNKNKGIKHCFLNNRVVGKLKKIDKIIKNIYSEFNKSSNASYIYNLTIPEGKFDVNVNELKSDVIFKDESLILNEIDTKLRTLHEERRKIESIQPNSQNDDISKFLKNHFQTEEKNQKSKMAINEFEDKVPNVISTTEIKINKPDNTKSLANPKLKFFSGKTQKSNEKLNFKNLSQPINNTPIKIEESIVTPIIENKNLTKLERIKSILEEKSNQESRQIPSTNFKEIEMKKNNENQTKNHKLIFKLGQKTGSKINLYTREEFDQYLGEKNNICKTNNSISTENQTILNIKKSDFRNAKIIGQFNLGFIICNINNNIYVIDQHASDEKITYEELLLNIKLTKQPSIAPIKINQISLAERNLLFEKKEFFHKLGFSIIKKEEEIYFNSFPSIYSYVFQIDDFLNIFNKYKEQSYKIHENFENFNEISHLFLSDSILRYIATKACRSSIMIGIPLNLQKMTLILEKLMKIKSPWNCPHGRPTMRHIYSYQH